MQKCSFCKKYSKKRLSRHFLPKFEDNKSYNNSSSNIHHSILSYNRIWSNKSIKNFCSFCFIKKRGCKSCSLCIFFPFKCSNKKNTHSAAFDFLRPFLTVLQRLKAFLTHFGVWISQMTMFWSLNADKIVSRCP